MTYENENQKSWWERMQHTYRLVIMNNETFEERGSYKLTLFNVYILLSTIFVVVFVLIFLLVAYTPLRKYIPGYGSASMNKELIELNKEVAFLEEQFQMQKQYTDQFNKILVGDAQTTVDDIEETTEVVAEDSLESVEPSQKEQNLRQEIENNEIGEAAKSGRVTNLTVKDTPLEKLYFTPPITGEISAGYQADKGHYGVDILAPKNTAIKAAMDGFVFISDWTLETGNTIGIQHANNVITFYKHNSALLKKVGSYVKAGEAVAIIGNTGTLTSGPHLHFELWHKGQSIDPTLYIQF